MLGKAAAEGFFLGGTSALALAGARLDANSYGHSCDRPEAGVDRAWFSRSGVDLRTIDASSLSRSLAGPQVLVAVVEFHKSADDLVELEGPNVPVHLILKGRQVNPVGAPALQPPPHARQEPALLAQTFQMLTCKAVHPVEARCCRWILRLHDRADGDRLLITHEFLAEMLAVQRSTVSVVLRTLQTAGLIRQGRGSITATDRAGLEEASCECYGRIRRIYERLLPGSYPPHAQSHG
jgi:hypothetical protein